MVEVKKYRLKKDRFAHPAGTVVYDCHKCDYGCVGDDNRTFGVQHTKVTLDPSGDYPFFTVPVQDLEKLEEEDMQSYRPRTREDSIRLFGLVPGSGESELFEVLDLIVAEFERDPMSVQCFDLRTVERAKAIVSTYRRELKKHRR